MNNETSASPQRSAGAGLHWTTQSSFVPSLPLSPSSLCAFYPTIIPCLSLKEQLPLWCRGQWTSSPYSVDSFPQSWKSLDLLAVCTGHPIKSPSLLKSSNCFKVRSCSPKFECFIPLLQRIWYHTRKKKKKKEENSNNSNHQSNAPGNISDLLKDDMEMVQRLENFSSVLWRSGHNREKEGKKFCFVTVAADPFLPQNPWSHYRSYSPTCTKLSDRWPRAI